MPEITAIQLVSPLVERNRLIGPEDLRPRDLLLALLRRVSLLATTSLADTAKTGLPCAESEPAHRQRQRAEQTTHRQQPVLASGIAAPLGPAQVGSRKFGPCRGREPFWPFLSIAPGVHAGKGAPMRLGALRVAAA